MVDGKKTVAKVNSFGGQYISLSNSLIILYIKRKSTFTLY